MFVIPLPGDSVETEGGVKHTVLSYAPYKQQPAVYVETKNASTESVLFSDVTAINGTPVSLTPGKVFKADSLVQRKNHLPQANDKILASSVYFKVKDLKLREHGKLADGILVLCENQDTKEEVVVRLVSVEDILRANGNTNFSHAAFQSQYKDYLGRKNA